MNKTVTFLTCILLQLVVLAVPLLAQRPTVSEAMEKASDDYEGERTINLNNQYIQPDSLKYLDYYKDDDGEVVYITDTTGVNAIETLVMLGGFLADFISGINEDDTTGRSYPAYAGLTLARGLMDGGNIDRVSMVTLSGGMYFSEHFRAGGTIGGNFLRVQDGTYLRNAVGDNMTIINAGVNATWYTTPRYTALGNYFTAGATLSFLIWEYENSLQVTNSGYNREWGANSDNTVTSDLLSGFEIYGGVGINLIQTPFLHIGLEAIPGVIFWEQKTSEGFADDTFNAFPYVKFGATAMVLF